MKKRSIEFKTISVVVITLAVFSLIVCAIGYRAFTNGLLEQYANGAFLTADAARLEVDGDRMEAYIESGGNSDEYITALNNLQDLCDSTDATFIYVIQPDTTDYAHITFIFSIEHKDLTYELYGFGYVRETTNGDYRNKYRALYEGKSDMELVVRDRGFIETDTHITAMVPVKNKYGRTVGILCVQRQLEGLADLRNDYILEVILVLIGISIFIMFAMSTFLRRVLLNPITAITKEASRFAEENEASETKLADRIRNEDEIGHLADAIDKMEEQIGEYIENITSITAERERINTELSLAARIQESALPNEFPAFPDRTDFDIYASMNPAKEVGGDFYDFFLLDEDHLCMVIADVSGKGVPAALLMMISKILINLYATEKQDPAEVLEAMNERLIESNREEMFITVWIGVLDLKTGVITAANAGHEYPVIGRNDGTYELYKDKHGFVAGAMQGTKYKNYEIKLEPGEKLFVYTDGLPETTNIDEEMLGIERVVEKMQECKETSPRGVLTYLADISESFAGDAPQFDDLTMLCVEYIGKQKRK